MSLRFSLGTKGWAWLAVTAVMFFGIAGACTASANGGPSPTATSSAPLPASTSTSSPNSGASPTPTTPAKRSVSVLYAGSLVNLMEKDLGPAFAHASRLSYQGEGHGSTADAHMIKDRLRTPDVFVSASPAADELLMGTSTHDYVRWYATVFGNQMVLGYNPKSKFASQLKAASGDPEKIFQVLESPGFRLGRTDPKLDPKGYRTLFLFQLAEKQYHLSGLSQKVLGAPENSAQIFAEEQMVARLEAGQLDAAFLYLNEAAEQQIPYLAFPSAINLGDPSQNSAYSQASWTDPSSGTTHKGGAIVYTVTIPTNAPNPAGGIAFIKYLLSANGEALLKKHGLPPLTIRVSGDTGAVPAQLHSLFGTG